MIQHDHSATAVATASPVMTRREVFISKTRAHLRRTTQKLRRTMIATGDWPPPTVVFATEVTNYDPQQEGRQKASSREDAESGRASSSSSCCFKFRFRKSSQDDVKNSRLSRILLGSYKNGGPSNSLLDNLKLTTGPDGSLICPVDVDVTTLIAGFQEFEKRFQFGNLMPFANVLPTTSRGPRETCIFDDEEEAGHEEISSANYSHQPKEKPTSSQSKTLELICEELEEE